MPGITTTARFRGHVPALGAMVLVLATISSCRAPSSGSPDLYSCEEVDAQAFLAALNDSLIDGLTVRAVWSVESNDYNKAEDEQATIWFVSAELDGGDMGGDGQIATWASQSIPDFFEYEEWRQEHLPADAERLPTWAGPIYAVDDLARRVSRWSDGRSAEIGVSMDRKGAQESRDCVTRDLEPE